VKIKLFIIGKTNIEYLKTGESEYENRLKHYCNFEEIIITDVKKGSKLSKNELKIREGDLILKNINSIDKVILLDNKGKNNSSNEFSNFLKENMLHSTKNLVFIIGGAYGFSEKVYNRANNRLSLSKMTFSHQMVRLIFKEQLYRAFTIIKGEKYHH
jgi:23S rRNA (pseudouridine1915-N3)-methyltransferase